MASAPACSSFRECAREEGGKAADRALQKRNREVMFQISPIKELEDYTVQIYFFGKVKVSQPTLDCENNPGKNVYLLNIIIPPPTTTKAAG